MRNKRFRYFVPVRHTLIIVFSCLSVFSLPAISQMTEMRADEVLREADFFLNADRTSEAIPYLQEYLKRAEGSADARVLSMAQDVRFKLARVFILENKLSSASDMLQRYTAQRPALEWRDAMKFWSTSLMELGRFEECVSVTTNALSGPPADVLAEIEAAAAAAAAMTDAVDNGLPEGYEENEYGEIVKKSDPVSGGAEVHPSGYSVEDLLILNMTLGEVYCELGKNSESVPPFTYVIEHTSNETHKGYAIMQIVNALVDARDFEELTRWIPQLYRTDARYDIRVNLALMKAATALFEAKEYDNALPLYRMILPRQELISHQAEKIHALQVEAGIIPPDSAGSEHASKVDETLFGKKYSVTGVEEFWSEQERDNPDLSKPKELIELEELVRTLQSLPPYEDEALYRNAYLYDEVSRPWEAVRFFDRVYLADPTSTLGERSFYEVIRLLLDPLDQRAEAEQRGLAYLDAEREGVVPRQVAYLLTGYYQQHEMMLEVKKLLPYIQAFVPSQDPVVLKYDCELYYMQAVADMVLLEYAQAEKGFQKVLTDFPGSHQQDNATYWHAITLLFQQKYEEAYAEFEAYSKKFPRGAWRASAAFQSGTCLFGMEKYDEALVRFTTVIETYPESTVYPDACSLRGDIYGSKGMLDEAVWDYERAIASARTQAQAKYAVFQMAAVFEAEDRYDEIIAVVSDYMERYGAEADIAEGIFWIGKTKINQGRVDEAVQSYFAAIVQYGTDLEQGGVDSMIGELVKLTKVRLSATQKAQLKKEIAEVLGDTDSLTLQLRLRAMLAQINGTEIELGKQLIAELPNLDNAAPPVLAAISDASFELKDYSRAKEILDVFVRKFDESEFMRPAFKLRAFDLYGSGDYEATLKVIADAQARYGTDYDVAWAQLMKGEIHIQQGKFPEAVEDFTAVLNVTGWRGESYAEATYRLGQAEEAAGQFLKAHGWYQRAYFQYKGYAGGAWAADAYLGSARCLSRLGLTNDVRNTYRAMLFDKYVNHLPQVEQAKAALGAAETLEIAEMIATGVKTNLTITVQQEEGQ